KEMYLSGPPLHVLAMALVARFREKFGDAYPISFSAGIDRANFPEAAALGLCPVTTCSDLLKPGGYGRMAFYFLDLAKRMDACGALWQEWVSQAKTMNARSYLAKLLEDPRYEREANLKLPPKVGTKLSLFDCITCDKCVPVCPNDANFTYVLPRMEVPVVKLR